MNVSCVVKENGGCVSGKRVWKKKKVEGTREKKNELRESPKHEVDK